MPSRPSSKRCTRCVPGRLYRATAVESPLIASYPCGRPQLITLGGLAELELVDSLDPFSEGIIFSVMPPKKSWKNISNLSGGEKTLSSLALVFALHVYKVRPASLLPEARRD